MNSRTSWTIKPCSDRTHTDHAPFRYYRADAQADVCDLCNWQTAWKGEQGWAGQYAPEVWLKLERALREAGER